ncbi:SIR2 family protein [Paeniglutamicibacter sp. ABSL32-1]|uniref:SIR2 family protein n=1 Tax=Paeniglutamicibacter quisquiliarum TaxID=2849498 RepID=UPI001C2D2AF1|nr:SIR2 family protein [Paeniglutamicibacter quisquiliarum]MBV1780040.1 SIR2 family protein [Paeniglutamicibacter quisquiliarum]
MAFSLNTAPGAYAVILGAGVSVASGVPSAWRVLHDLIEQIGAAKEVDMTGFDDNARLAWFRAEFGEEPTYEHLLEHLAPTQMARQELLKGYFEPTVEEREANTKGPTAAHRAIARMVADGAIRVILTLNFDNLMETALREQGITPTIVHGQSEISGIPPLHTVGALLVHLHGDYTYPGEMRNTVTELSEYTPETETFLDRIFEDFGLLIVGWSAQYDPVLVRAMRRTFRRIYVPFWIEPGTLAGEAADLAGHLGSTIVKATADDALGALHDSYLALRDRANSRHPLTVATAVASAKRELAGRYTAIGLHDTIKREADTLRNHADLVQSYTGTAGPGGHKGMVERLEDACRVLEGLVAATAYWGDEGTDQWWLGEIAAFGKGPSAGGTTDVLELHNLVVGRLFYAAGIGATASGRYEILRNLFEMHIQTTGGRGEPATVLLDPMWLYPGFAAASRRMFGQLRTLFVEHLVVGSSTFESSWERFEVMRTIHAIPRIPVADRSLASLRLARKNKESAAAKYREAEAQSDADVHDDASASLRQSRQELGRRQGAFADHVPLRTPHVRVWHDEHTQRFRACAAVELSNELTTAGNDHPIHVSKLLPYESNDLIEVLDALSVAAHRIAYAAHQGGSLVSRSRDVWLDEA